MLTEHLVVNLTGAVRREYLNGREYLVAPVSMIVPGVLNGSHGPGLYTQEENAKSASLWNGAPITNGHPSDSQGNPISARDPSIVELGKVHNTSSNGKLTAEAWFDVLNTRRVNSRILDRLHDGQPIELSTGLGLDKEQIAGEFNGKAYQFIARNYRPDHLAILTEDKGACSLEDGCGVLVNTYHGSHDQLRGELMKMLQNNFTQDQPMAYIEEVFDNFFVYSQNNELYQQKYSSSNGLKMTGNPKKVRRKVEFEEMTSNVTKKMGSDNLSASAFAYVPDPKKPSTWKLRIDDAAHVGGAIAAIGKGFRGQKANIPSKDLAVVKRKIRAAWLKFHSDKSSKDLPSIIRNAGGDNMALTEDQRTEYIDELINNCNCEFDEDDRDVLNDFNDEKLIGWSKRMSKEKKRQAVQNAAEKGASELNPPKEKEVVTNQVPQITPDMLKNALKELPEKDWLDLAPKNVRNQLAHSQAIIDREKTGLIDRLVANESLSDEDKQKAKDFLVNKDLDELKFMVGLLPQEDKETHTGVPTLNYSGSSGPVNTPISKPTEHLIAPEIDFAELSPLSKN